MRGGDVDAKRRSGKIDDQASNRCYDQPPKQRRRSHPRRPVGRTALSGSPLSGERMLERILSGRPGLAGGRRRLQARHLYYATQCQVANWAAKAAISAAENTSVGIRVRGCAASQAPSQIPSGNSTTKKRGNDISGWDATG